MFSLNDVGRPLAQSFTYGDGEVAPGSGWSFELSLPGPFASHAARFNFADE